MPMLWFAVHLPWLSLEAFAATLTAEQRRRPLALLAEHQIQAVNAAAADAGVKPGLKRATALALAPELLLGQADATRDEGPRGDPTPIVLLHGTSASLHTWEGWAHTLKAQRRVISLDLPGFGLTGPFSGRYTPDDYRGDTYARFVIDLLDTLQLPRVVLGGNSLGGEIAWRVATLAPERVDRLVGRRPGHARLLHRTGCRRLAGVGLPCAAAGERCERSPVVPAGAFRLKRRAGLTSSR